MSILNPFIVGQPLFPEQFIGHSKAIDTIRSRLTHAASTSIVGASQTGRTSLMRYLVSDYARQIHPELSDFWPILYEVGFHQELTHAQFWSAIFRKIIFFCQKEIEEIERESKNWNHDGAKEQESEEKKEHLERLTEIKFNINRGFEKVESNRLSKIELREIVNSIAEAGYRLLIAIDNFDRLMTHPKLTTSLELRERFFGQIRDLCQLPSRGMATIVTSTRPLVDIWQYSRGSELFNLYYGIYLGHLSDDEVNKYLDQMFLKAGIQFSDFDKQLIRSKSGNLPAFVQFYANLVFESCVKGESEISRKERIEYERRKPENIHVQLTRHLWRQMTRNEQEALKKAVQTPNLLSNEEKNILRALKDRGGLPPVEGVFIP